MCYGCNRVLRKGETFALYLEYRKSPTNPLRARVCETCMRTDYWPLLMTAQEWVRALPSLPGRFDPSKKNPSMKRSIPIQRLSMVLVLFVAMLFSACTDERGARNTLIGAGYHPMRVGGYGWASCGESDVFSTRFTAWSPDSTRKVSGCVCRGWLKGNTIRFD